MANWKELSRQRKEPVQKNRSGAFKDWQGGHRIGEEQSERSYISRALPSQAWAFPLGEVERHWRPIGFHLDFNRVSGPQF